MCKKGKKKLTAQLSLTQTYCEQHKPGYELHLVREDEDLTELEVQKWDLIYIYIYTSHGGGNACGGGSGGGGGEGKTGASIHVTAGGGIAPASASAN